MSYTEEDYSEEIFEAVKSNVDYLTQDDIDPDAVAFFIEAVAECLYDGEVLEQVAKALRDI